MRDKDVLGRWGEAVACRYLSGLGWQLLARNWRCPLGELDVVGLDPAGATVFCEVKTRSTTSFGDPAEAVTRAKQQRIRQLAGRWLHESAGRPGADVRFDVLSIVRRPDGRASIRHLRAAF